MFERELSSALVEHEQKNLYRRRYILDSPQSTTVEIEGRSFLNFCSNDYLGLANHPEVINSFRDAAGKYGVGGGASHLVIGHSRPHQELEEALADFTGRPAVVLFSSGFMANLGVITVLLEQKDAIFEDRLNHASLLDAGRFSGARFQRYLHCDTENLERRIKKTEARRRMIVTDGVFSMDGNQAPLTELALIAKKYNACLMVDDAHGFGVCGKTGAGSLEHQRLSVHDVPVLMGTLGKAFGTMGAFVAGSKVVAESMTQFARSYVYTTAMPPAVAAATLTSLELVKRESWRREKLAFLIEKFRKGCADIGLTLMPSDTPIQPVLAGSAKRAIRLHEMIKKQGVFISAIRPPSVPAGTSRLRVSLSAMHTEQQITRLLDALEFAYDTCKEGMDF